LFERADLSRFIFARHEFQAVISRRQNHSTLVEKIAVAHLLEMFSVQVHGNGVAQLRDDLAGGHGAHFHGKIEFGVLFIVFLRPIERAGSDFRGDGHVSLRRTQPEDPSFDRDGKLDLMVANYVDFDLATAPAPGQRANCVWKGVPVMCGPRGLRGEPDHLFHNNGDGTFTDVSEKAGVADKDRHYGFTSVFVDVNNDGKVDLLVADDSTPNYLYINKGNGTFEDASIYSGFGLNQDGFETASMGLAVGDYRNDGAIGLYTGTFSDDYKVLYHSDGHGNFTDITPEMGMAEITYPFLTWSTEFIDYDNDGWKDLFAVNGHVYPQVDQNEWGTSFAERPFLFHNVKKGSKFELVPPVEGTGLAEVVPGRGAAFGDLFNNGKIDVVINCMDHVPVLLKNVNPDKNHWIGLKLIGGPKSPRDAIGTTVYLTAGGVRQRADVMSGGSYESSNDQRLHFGIGASTRVTKVEIRWPSGLVEQISLPAVDRYFTIEEGKGTALEARDKMAQNSQRQPLSNAK